MMRMPASYWQGIQITGWGYLRKAGDTVYDINYIDDPKIWNYSS
jgi:hypothetical protein